MTTTINNTDIRLEFNHLPQSRGAYSIIVTAFMLDNNHSEIFRVRTTDAGFIDHINEMKADDARSEDIDLAYYNHVYDNIEERLYEWVDKCDMEDIMNEANDQLGGGILYYDYEFKSIINYYHKYEGFEIDMAKEYNKYVLTTNTTQITYETKSQAIQGLIDMYSAD